MTLYILVHAVFHDTAEEDRKMIYKCLEDKHWSKIRDHRINTIWKAHGDMSYDDLSKIAESNFQDCEKTRGKKVDVVYQIGDRPIKH